MVELEHILIYIWAELPLGRSLFFKLILLDSKYAAFKFMIDHTTI